MYCKVSWNILLIIKKNPVFVSTALPQILQSKFKLHCLHYFVFRLLFSNTAKYVETIITKFTGLRLRLRSLTNRVELNFFLQVIPTRQVFWKQVCDSRWIKVFVSVGFTNPDSKGFNLFYGTKIREDS